MGIIAGLGLSGAIERATILVMMIVPFVLIIPLIKAAQQKGVRTVWASKGPAQRRYSKRVALFMALYLAAYALIDFTITNGNPPLALRVFLAGLPGVAIAGLLWAIARLIAEEQDEFLRMLMVRQSLIATGFALGVSSIWGFGEAADMVPHLDAYWVTCAWFLGLAIGSGMNHIQYGSRDVP